MITLNLGESQAQYLDMFLNVAEEHYRRQMRLHEMEPMLCTLYREKVDQIIELRCKVQYAIEKGQ